MSPAHRTSLCAALIAVAASACGGSHPPRHAPAATGGPAAMSAAVDAVHVESTSGCARGRSGGGLTDGKLVLTSAALVAGAAEVQVTNPHGKQVSGRVVALDPATDVAWLYAPGLPSVPTAPATNSDRVVPAYVFATTATGAVVPYRAQTLQRLAVTDTDVFGAGSVRRQIYRLQLDQPLAAPAAGAPVLDSSGHLLGIVTTSRPPGARTLDVVAGDTVAASAATRALAGHDPATMATSAGARCAVAVSTSS